MDLISIAIARKIFDESSSAASLDMNYYFCSDGEYNSGGVPTVSDPDDKTFYIVPSSGSNGIYNVYVNKDNSWELFKSVTIDMSKIPVDNTLTLSGKAADAKKVGDEISDLKDDLSSIESLFDINSTNDISVDGYNDSNDISTIMSNSPFVLHRDTYDYSGCKVYKIKLKVATAGRLSVGTIKKANALVDQPFDRANANIKEVLNITSTGTQEVNISNPFVIAQDEFLLIGMPTDTCVFKYGDYGNAKKYIFANAATGNWGGSIMSLGISVYVTKYFLVNKFVSRFSGKKLSIIGDSIDTFDKDGYKISGYNMWYPSGSVTDVEQTWWKKVLNASGMELEINASWSGSRVTDTHPDASYPDFYDRVSVIGDPDIIFVTLGTNDSTYNIALGEYDFTTAYTSLSESEFRPAYIKGVKALQETYPDAQIVCISEKMGDAYRESIIHIADELGVTYIDVGDYEGENGVHPGEYGMRQIASLALYPTDFSFTQKHIAADSNQVGIKLSELQAEIDDFEPGLSLTAKEALLACFEHVAWSDSNGSLYYNNLRDALGVSVHPLYNWDFTQSLTDSITGRVAQLVASTGVSAPVRDAQGVHFNDAGQALMLFDTNKPLTDFRNKTIQIDVLSFVPQSSNNNFHVRFLMYNRPNIGWDSGMVFRQAASPNLGWNIYGDGGWGSTTAWGPLTNRTDISGHTVSLYIDENLVPSLYIDSVLKGKQSIGFHESGVGLTVGNINANPAAQGGTFYISVVTGCRIYDGEVV